MSKIETVTVPNIGDFQGVEIIEIGVKPGDTVKADEALITLETEKATLDVPSPLSGEIESLLVKVGDKVSQGDAILKIKVAEGTISEALQKAASAPRPLEQAPSTQGSEKPVVQSPSLAPVAKAPEAPIKAGSITAHAGPATRKMAHALGVDLSKVNGSGIKGRVTTQDIEKYVKAMLQEEVKGIGVSTIPAVDFTQFGEIESKPLSRIKKLTARNMLRNWLNIPHVTQFDEADVTELEQFRIENKEAAKSNGINLTPVSFIIKAVVSALKIFPQFNASLSANGEELIYKKYFHIGVAVDTPNGLMVPVIKDADRKGLFEIADELGELSALAKSGQIKAQDLQGNTFSVSSLGPLGGTQFTPIVNAPDVAILGVSRLLEKPMVVSGEIKVCKMLPLALSYDHRVIDGVEGAKFMQHLCSKLQDIRKLLL